MDAERKARLGGRWSCVECSGAFYDLGKPEAVCPKCNTTQPEHARHAAPRPKRASKKVRASGRNRAQRYSKATEPPQEKAAFSEHSDDEDAPLEVALED